MKRGSTTALSIACLVFFGANFIAYRFARAFLSRITDTQKTQTPHGIGLAYETQKFSGAFGLTLDAWFIPHDRARGIVVLFHGYGSNKIKLLPAARIFHDLGYSALLVDFHACGDSEGERTSLGFYESADVAAALRQARRIAEAKPVILFGTSMGAVAVLKSVADGADPDAIIVDSPFDRMLTAIGRYLKASRVPSFPAAHLLTFWGGGINGYNGFRHASLTYAKSVRCPTLLELGLADERVRESEARAIYDRMNGPKRWMIYPGVGHGVLAEKAPFAWKATISDFLSAYGDIRVNDNPKKLNTH